MDLSVKNYEQVGKFFNGVAVVKIGNEYNYIDVYDNLLLKENVIFARDFYCGHGLVYTKQDTIDLVNKKGELVLKDCKYSRSISPDTFNHCYIIDINQNNIKISKALNRYGTLLSQEIIIAFNNDLKGIKQLFLNEKSQAEHNYDVQYLKKCSKDKIRYLCAEMLKMGISKTTVMQSYRKYTQEFNNILINAEQEMLKNNILLKDNTINFNNERS